MPKIVSDTLKMRGAYINEQRTISSIRIKRGASNSSR